MDLLPTEEQQHIVDTAANFLADQFPVSRLLDLADSGSDFTPAQLQKIAALGWLGIGLPEEFDGVGYGLAEEALVFVELGRNLMPPSILGSVLGARIAALGGATSTLGRILDGTTRIGLASARLTSPADIGTDVDGEFLVYEAQDTDLILVADENGAALLPLSALQCLQTEQCIDETLGLSTWRATGTPALCYLPAQRDPIFLRGALLISALLLGIAEATLARSVEYAKERVQFGKAIGSFQAIKHYCAQMSIRCESVRAQLYHASITLAEGTEAGLFDTFALKALAIEAAQLNANTAVQIHGGMGYTREMDIHLFVKRAQVLGSLFGSERFHLKKLLLASAPA
jgi:alkylation response protein AidB-like acyl-CoA dehydrogenase